jgi:hypothetical protein
MSGKRTLSGRWSTISAWMSVFRTLEGRWFGTGRHEHGFVTGERELIEGLDRRE